MNVSIENRLRKLEATNPPEDFGFVGRIIADPKQDAWAATDEGIEGEIARRQAEGLLPAHVIVRKIVSPPMRD